MNKPELLAPAGDMEKLKMAVLYGADAVYFGGISYGLRSASKNFTRKEIEEAIIFCHKNLVKAYVTLNISMRDSHFSQVHDYLNFLAGINTDALIVSDVGLVNYVKENFPFMEIHLSTQANTTNSHSVSFWKKLGVKRIVLARELDLKEIKDIVSNVPGMEIETFVHGAMCISYSGRCLLSSYMNGRHANLGDCSQPCRWKYYIMEENREGEFYPIEEDDEGTYIMNSKDLCMIEDIGELLNSGINSFKIEGRMKSSYYTATVIRSYRKAIDDAYEGKLFDSYWLDEVKKASHRDFTSGFYYGNPNKEGQLYSSSTYIREYDFIGLVKSYDKSTSTALVEQRNKFSSGEEVEIFGPEIKHFNYVINQMYSLSDEPILSAPHPQQLIKLKIDREVKPGYIIRKKRNH